jgi:hypothetical protein
MSQNRSSAVMQQRAPREVEGDNDERKRWRDLDFFPTPPWAARACAELILKLDPAAENVWEPACGQKHFAAPLSEFFDVCATDIHSYGPNTMVMDFLDRKAQSPAPFYLPQIDWVVTNPPFSLAKEFALRGLEVACKGVLLLCRVALLESEGRQELLYTGDHPLTVLAPFVERVPMQLGSWDPELRSATAYAAFVWIKGAAPRAPMPILAGTRARLWKPDDVERFAVQSSAPLLERA